MVCQTRSKKQVLLRDLCFFASCFQSTLDSMVMLESMLLLNLFSEPLKLPSRQGLTGKISIDSLVLSRTARCTAAHCKADLLSKALPKQPRLTASTPNMFINRTERLTRCAVQVISESSCSEARPLDKSHRAQAHGVNFEPCST